MSKGSRSKATMDELFGTSSPSSINSSNNPSERAPESTDNHDSEETSSDDTISNSSTDTATNCDTADCSMDACSPRITMASSQIATQPDVYPDEQYVCRYDFDKLQGSQKMLEVELDNLRRNILERLSDSVFHKIEDIKKENKNLMKEISEMKQRKPAASTITRSPMDDKITETARGQSMRATESTQAKPTAQESLTLLNMNPANLNLSRPAHKDASLSNIETLASLQPQSTSQSMPACAPLPSYRTAHPVMMNQMPHTFIANTHPMNSAAFAGSPVVQQSGFCVIPGTTITLAYDEQNRREEPQSEVEGHLPKTAGDEMRRQIDLRLMQPVPSKETIAFLKDLTAYYSSLIAANQQSHPGHDQPSTSRHQPFASGRPHEQFVHVNQSQHTTHQDTVERSSLLKKIKADIETRSARKRQMIPTTSDEANTSDAKMSSPVKAPKVKRKAAVVDLDKFCCRCHPRSSGTCLRCHGPNGYCTNCRNKNCRFKKLTYGLPSPKVETPTIKKKKTERIEEMSQEDPYPDYDTPSSTPTTPDYRRRDVSEAIVMPSGNRIKLVQQDISQSPAKSPFTPGTMSSAASTGTPDRTPINITSSPRKVSPHYLRVPSKPEAFNKNNNNAVDQALYNLRDRKQAEEQVTTSEKEGFKVPESPIKLKDITHQCDTVDE